MTRRVVKRWAEGRQTLGWNAVDTRVFVVELADGRVARGEYPVGAHREIPWRVVNMPFDKAAEGMTEVDPSKRTIEGVRILPAKRWGS